MQMLVYENYNKFISATETIQQMKAKVASLSPRCSPDNRDSHIDSTFLQRSLPPSLSLPPPTGACQVDGMDGVMKNLSDSVKEITDSSNHINANLAERRYVVGCELQAVSSKL